MPSADASMLEAITSAARKARAVASCRLPGSICHFLRLFLDQLKGWVGAMSEDHSGGGTVHV